MELDWTSTEPGAVKGPHTTPSLRGVLSFESLALAAHTLTAWRVRTRSSQHFLQKATPACFLVAASIFLHPSTSQVILIHCLIRLVGVFLAHPY